MNDHVAKPIEPALLFETVGRFYRQKAEALQPSPLSNLKRDEHVVDVGELGGFDGIDAEDGLRRLQGNRRSYIKHLRQFASQQADAADRIRQQINTDDLESAMRTAHTVHGVAGNLGAIAVQKKAAALERAIRARAGGEELEALCQQFAVDLSKLVQHLGRALPPEAVESVADSNLAFDPSELKPAVEQMLKLISEFDSGAHDEFMRRRNLFASLLSGHEVERFANLLDSYAFADAQTLLESAAKARGLFADSSNPALP
jgi:two-component system sensor histidine kinase/response regulator